MTEDERQEWNDAVRMGDTDEVERLRNHHMTTIIEKHIAEEEAR